MQLAATQLLRFSLFASTSHSRPLALSTFRLSFTRPFKLKFLTALFFSRRLLHNGESMSRCRPSLRLTLVHPPIFQSYGNSNGYSGHNGSYGGGYGGGGYGGSWGGGDRTSDGLGGNLRSIDWSQYKQTPFEKNFYVEDKRVSSRSDREIEEFRRAKEIKV